MEFPKCKVTAVKADIANGELKVTFSMALNDENLETAQALGMYVDTDAGQVELRIIPQQPPLKLSGVTAEMSVVNREQE